MGKDIGNGVVNVCGYTDVYLELDLQFNGHHLVQLFGNHLLLLDYHIWCKVNLDGGFAKPIECSGSEVLAGEELWTEDMFLSS